MKGLKVKQRVSNLFTRKRSTKSLQDCENSNSSTAVPQPTASTSSSDGCCETTTRPQTWLSSEEIEACNRSLAKGRRVDAEEATDQTQQQQWLATAKGFVERVNRHDNRSAKELVTPDNHWHFYNLSKTLENELPWSCWAEEHERINASFPDFRFVYRQAVLVPGGIALQGFRASGTHTGEPYAMGACEPIPANGTKVLNDEEETYLFFRPGESEIARIVVCPKGEMTGPAGFYTQIGGFPMM